VPNVGGARYDAAPPGDLATLSGREIEILGLLATGLSNRGIADRLGITPRTVEAHLTSAFLKLGLVDETHVNRRVLAVLTYLGQPTS
jgi:DNA-binding NarL/FixJ family response regulator